MKTIGVMVGITFALTALYVLLYLPEANRLGRLKNEYNTAKEELASVRQKISLRPNVEKDIERVKKDIVELEATTVRKDEIALAIEVFETEAYRLGISKGVLIKVIDSKDGGAAGTEEEDPSDTVRDLRFRIVLRCSYRELLRYVSSLGKLPILVTVDSVAVRKIEETEAGLRAELAVCTYSLQ